MTVKFNQGELSKKIEFLVETFVDRNASRWMCGSINKENIQG